MFFKKITVSQSEKDAFREKLALLVPDAVDSKIAAKELMLRWLSAFAPDMTLRDAKDFCLPRRRYKNYLWHAFNYRLTDCLAGEEALESYTPFVGECCILSEETGEAFTACSGETLTPELLTQLGNVTVFTKDLSETFTVTGKDETGPYYKKA